VTELQAIVMERELADLEKLFMTEGFAIVMEKSVTISKTDLIVIGLGDLAKGFQFTFSRYLSY